MSELVAVVADGIIYSSWLFIIAVGLTLIYGVMKILNMAHGSLYALGAYAAGRGMSTLLFGVAPGDAATFATAVAVTLLVALAGSSVPAFKAVRVSPMSVLKAE